MKSIFVQEESQGQSHILGILGGIPRYVKQEFFLRKCLN